MQPIDILKGTRELLSDPARWTKGQFARDKGGFVTRLTSNDAVCWCVRGAILKTYDDHGLFFLDLFYLSTRLIERALPADLVSKSKEDGKDPIVDFNDDPNTTHEDVLKVLDKAIELAAKEAQL